MFNTAKWHIKTAANALSGATQCPDITPEQLIRVQNARDALFAGVVFIQIKPASEPADVVP